MFNEFQYNKYQLYIFGKSFIHSMNKKTTQDAEICFNPRFYCKQSAKIYGNHIEPCRHYYKSQMLVLKLHIDLTIIR